MLLQRDEGRVEVVAEQAALAERFGLERLEDVFAREGEVRPEGIKSLVRIDAEGESLYVKRYEFRPARELLRGALKLNPPIYSGPRELHNLLAMAEAGLRVPTPIAAGEADAGGRRRSFVALRQLAGHPLSELPAPADPLARRALLNQLADLVGRLHRAGFWHRDLYACNVFVAPEGLGLLDCERVGRREGLPRRRWRIKDLAALDYSLEWPS
ncbi:MAG TPA: hypothetical protein DEA08_29085, partial [Planctomycetes bacterium]|nr:hypothetical protein [Planctomycetota bacterium]